MFKGYNFPSSIILHAVYLKLRFSLSYRDIEALLQIRGIDVEHATVQRWVTKFSQLLEPNKEEACGPGFFEQSHRSKWFTDSNQH